MRKFEAMSRTTCATLAAGLLLTAAMAPAFADPAPKGAKETITIKGESDKKSAPVTTTTKTTTQVTMQKKTVVNRDPFVQGTVSDGGTSGVKHTVKTVTAKTPGTSTTVKVSTSAPAKPPEPVVVAPAVNVHGIVQSASGNRAILVSPNQTYIVKAGDKLGDYRVADIGTQYVIFKYKDKSFKLKMDSEFGASGAPGAKASSPAKKK